MKRRVLVLSLALAGACAVAVGYHVGRARASGIPTANPLAYSGTLLNNGQPDNGTHFILLKLWTTGSTTSPACSTIPAGSIQLSNGRFTLPLDASCLPVIHGNPDVQVEVVVDGVSMGKAPLSAVPYAVEADTASNFAPGSAIANLVPPGTVVPFAGVVGGSVSAPPGWLFCDGGAVSRAQYPGLFGAIGTGWGEGDGATTFNLPDLRGRFLRGVDGGQGRDPEAATRAASASGGNTGDKVGTTQGDAFAQHNHPLTDPGHTHSMWNTYSGSNLPSGGFQYAGATTGPQTGNSVTGISIKPTGGAETRPTNVTVNYLIKL